MSAHDRIDLGRLRSAIAGTRFSGHLHHFARVDSTNSLLLADAAHHAPEGTVYVADEQTAGRGRGNHAWHSSPGDGLYLSLLVRPDLAPEHALLLSLATGLAVQHAVLEAVGLTLDIRWPNDLMIGPQIEFDAEDGLLPPLIGQKKCGGILVETALGGGKQPRLRYAVIGIGLNVHHEIFPPELEEVATSLAIADRARRDDPDDIVPLFRTPILVALLRRLDRELLELERHGERGRARLIERFSAASSWVRGRRVHVPEQGGYTGKTAGLDERGFLLLDCDDGRRRTVLSGGVRAL
jgi:BirA family biotin operon repressor/biotin-[acetyl-CoA-carboxylase] ligase